jgi:hypothetical protein
MKVRVSRNDDWTRWTAEPASALMYKEPRPDQHTQREKASVFRASGGVAHNDIMLKRA